MKTNQASTDRSGADAAGEAADGLFDSLLQASLEPRRSTPAGVHVGRVVGLTDSGQPLVAGSPGAQVIAQTTVPLLPAHLGCRVVVMYEENDVNRPIVLGVIHETALTVPAEPAKGIEVDVDGRRLLVAASERIVLRCGKASITLTSEGKVLIEGEYVSAQSRGVHRIKGGSVQIN